MGIWSSAIPVINDKSKQLIRSRRPSNASFSEALIAKVNSAWSGRPNDSLIVSIMLPLYYTKENMNANDLNLLTKLWNFIIMDRSPIWFNIRKEVQFKSCHEWFEWKFYERLFDIHPFSKQMFRKLFKI